MPTPSRHLFVATFPQSTTPLPTPHFLQSGARTDDKPHKATPHYLASTLHASPSWWLLRVPLSVLDDGMSSLSSCGHRSRMRKLVYWTTGEEERQHWWYKNWWWEWGNSGGRNDLWWDRMFGENRERMRGSWREGVLRWSEGEGLYIFGPDEYHFA